MGSWLSKLLGFKQPVQIAMLGLDSAGKTSILYKLKLGEIIATIPTIGFNVETLDYKNITFTVWDVGGQTALRPLWKKYYQHSQALIYVVDSSDTSRIKEARTTLYQILSDDDLKNTALLVYANKCDETGALTASELVDQLGLLGIKNRKWYCQSSCAITGDGIFDGLDWLTRNINYSN